MEPNVHRMSDAARLAECDRRIEEILAERQDEINAFLTSGDLRYLHVQALCCFMQARRLLLIDQVESQHAEGEQRNVESMARQVETVTTWVYGTILVLSGAVVIALIQGIAWLCHLE